MKQLQKDEEDLDFIFYPNYFLLDIWKMRKFSK